MALLTNLRNIAKEVAEHSNYVYGNTMKDPAVQDEIFERADKAIRAFSYDESEIDQFHHLVGSYLKFSDHYYQFVSTF